MIRNKRKIIAMLLFVVMSLFMFAFANPDGELDNELLKPTITLNESNVYSMEVHTDIPEFKATAKDSQGRDLDVTIENNINKDIVGTYELSFKAVDDFDNEKIVERDFTVVDTTRPIITLIGNNTINILFGLQNYTDQRARVTDNYDPQITINGITNGNVNNIGSYRIIYNYTDSNANVANQVVRNVNLLNPDLDTDGDGFTNRQEFEAGTNYLDINNFPTNEVNDEVTSTEITIDENNIYEMQVNENLPEFKATAKDNLNNDVIVTITNNIDVTTLGTYTVTFTANTEILTREFYVIDSIAPLITNFTINKNSWTNSDIITSWNIIETGSGVNTVQYSSDNITWSNLNIIEYYGLTRSNERNDKLYIRAIDNANNISNLIEFELKIDKTLPTIEIDGNIPNAYYKLSDVMNVYVTDLNYGNTYIYKYDNLNNKELYKTFDTIVGPSFNINSLLEGKYDIFTIDLAGNKSNVYTFEIDRTKPVMQVLKPTENQILKNDAIKVNVNVTDNRGLSLLVINLYKDGTLFKSFSKTLSGETTYSYEHDLTGLNLTDGLYYVKANALDIAGNMSNTVVRNFIIDMQKPVMQVLKPTENQILKNDAIKVNVNVTDNRGLSLLVINLYKDGTLFKSFSKTLSGETTYSYEHDLTGLNLTDGLYYVKANALDIAGNMSNTVVRNFIIDMQKPIMQVLKPTENQILKNDEIKVNVNVTDNRGLSLLIINLYKDGTLFKSFSKTLSGETTYSYEHDLTGLNLADGLYYVKVNALDIAGNMSNTVVRNFELDSTLPVINIDDKLPKSFYGFSDLMQVHVIDNNYETTYIYKYDDLNNKILNSVFGSEIGPSFSINTLSEGKYDIYSVDKIGNVSTIYTFIIDKTNPIAKIISPNIDDLTFGKDVTIIGEVESSELNIKSHWFEIKNPDGSYSYSSNMNTSNLSYAFNLNTTKGSGVYTIRYVATDKSGNRSDSPNYTNSVVRTLTVDLTNPTTTIQVGNVIDGKFTVSGIANDNYRLNRVYVQLVNRQFNKRCGGTTINLLNPDQNTANWSLDYDITTLSGECSNEGYFAAHVSAVDYFGNTSSAGWTDNFYVTAPISFTLTYTPSTGGTITGNTSQTVIHNQNGTEVMALPEIGYKFVEWSDGVTTTSRTDLNVTSNISVTAIFEKIQYTLAYNPSTGGTITGNISQTVNYGENGTGVTAIPNTGYIFDKWSDGVATASRTDLNVTSNINVTAQFRGDYIDVTSSGITFDNKNLILTLNSKVGIDLSTVSYYVNYYIDVNNDLLDFVGPKSYSLIGSDTHNSSQIIHTVDRGNNGNNTYKAIVTLKNSIGDIIQILEFIKQS